MAFSVKDSSSCSFGDSADRYEGHSDHIENKNLYKSDKSCIRCRVKFGFSMTIYKKKYWCKFCRRGVCADCSPQRVPNPETMRIDRICNACYQRVMTDHFKREINEEISKLKGQIDEFNFLYGQEVKRRAVKTAKKKILEGILMMLEKESEAKDREMRVKLSKMRAKKDSVVGKMNGIVKKFHETQREREKKEKKIKELEAEAEKIKEKFDGDKELWQTMKKLREKKVKLLKKSDFSLSSNKELQLENYEELQQTQREISEENKQLLEELSQLTAELEIKELKIKSLQKKIAEMSAVFQSESEFDSENQEVKLKIQLQQDKILALQAHLKKSEVALEELSTKPCCILF